MESTVFTSAALLGILSQIDELKDCFIGITEEIDSDIQLQVGDSVYTIPIDNADRVVVDNSVVGAIEGINVQAYDDLVESGEVDLHEPVESGILSELAKTLFVGGLVRLGGKLVRNGVI